MNLDVLIAAPQDDIHALSVLDRLLKLGANSAINDLSWKSDLEFLEGHLSSDETQFSMCWSGMKLTESTVIWWRRNRSPVASQSVAHSVSQFVSQEKRHGLYGLLHATGCRFSNNPLHEERANYKAVQLAAAAKLKLPVPRTCITNNSATARSFINEMVTLGKKCIFKGFTPCRQQMTETRLIGESGFEALEDSLAYSPVIFQEFIPRKHDLRVFCVGNEAFAVECHTEHEELVDWRLDPLVDYRPIDIPQLRNLSRRILDELALDSGSLDFRMNREDEIIFLEVNPSGQFLFMESDLGFPVSEALANFLLAKPKPSYLRSAVL